MRDDDTPFPLAGVRGLLIDVDGVLRVGEEPIPGAGSTIAALRDRQVPFRLLTNATTASRATLGARLRATGIAIVDDELLTAPVATAAYLHRHFHGARCALIVKGDVETDFLSAGLTIVPVETDEPVGVVVIGGAEERLTYERLNHAFRHLRAGARLVTMHRNRFWRTPEGLKLDSGPFVRALEEAAGVRATVIGKPAAPFFRHGLRALGLPPGVVAMIGDDAPNDLVPARRLGMRGVLVRTGKPVESDHERQADLVLDAFADLPAVWWA